MVTKGIIQSINFNGNTCTLRLPFFETTHNDPIITNATFSNAPGIYNGYKVNDVVWVAFEDGQMETPVVIGKLYLGAEKEKADPRGTVNTETFNATKTATIPADTTLKTGTDKNIPNTAYPYNSLASVANDLNALNKDVEYHNWYYENKIKNISSIANGKSTTYYSDTDPSKDPNITLNIGDTWFNTGNPYYNLGKLKNKDKYIGYWIKDSSQPDGYLEITTDNVSDLDESNLPDAYTKAALFEWSGYDGWHDVDNDIIANKLTVNKINAMGITAKKIEVLDTDNNILFKANGLPDEPDTNTVQIADFTVDENSLYSGTPSEEGSVLVSTGTDGEYEIGNSSKQSGWAFTAGKAFGVTNQGELYASSGDVGGWNIQPYGLRSELSGHKDDPTISPFKYLAFIGPSYDIKYDPFSDAFKDSLDPQDFHPTRWSLFFGNTENTGFYPGEGDDHKLMYNGKFGITPDGEAIAKDLIILDGNIEINTKNTDGTDKLIFAVDSSSDKTTAIQLEAEAVNTSILNSSQNIYTENINVNNIFSLGNLIIKEKTNAATTIQVTVVDDWALNGYSLTGKLKFEPEPQEDLTIQITAAYSYKYMWTKPGISIVGPDGEIQPIQIAKTARESQSWNITVPQGTDELLITRAIHVSNFPVVEDPSLTYVDCPTTIESSGILHHFRATGTVNKSGANGLTCSANIISSEGSVSSNVSFTVKWTFEEKSPLIGDEWEETSITVDNVVMEAGNSDATASYVARSGWTGVTIKEGSLLVTITPTEKRLDASPKILISNFANSSIYDTVFKTNLIPDNSSDNLPTIGNENNLWNQIYCNIISTHHIDAAVISGPGAPLDNNPIHIPSLLPTSDIYGYDSVGRQNIGSDTENGRWGTIYLKNSPNVSSDLKIKTNINYNLNNYEKLFDSLQPTTYNLKEDPNILHFGFIAQDVEKALNVCNIDSLNNGLIKVPKNEDEIYFLNYTELHALEVTEIQRLKKQVKELTEELKKLKNKKEL